MKCKVFTYEYTDTKQSEVINNWLESVGEIKILHMAQSSGRRNCSVDPRDGEMVETILTIFYE